MTVSKRTRFEILRRDSNACQYCGQMAPDVVLHIDHVIPVALGGSDDPSNLVAACKDCNVGKSSISPDSPIVAAVGERSADYAMANANRMKRITADLQEMDDFAEEFDSRWTDFTYSKNGTDVALSRPVDWRNTLGTWWKMSVPLDLILSSVNVAMAANHVDLSDRFRYFCGVIWRTLEEYDVRYPATTNEAALFTDAEMDARGAYDYERGRVAGWRLCQRMYTDRDLVSAVVDSQSLERVA